MLNNMLKNETLLVFLLHPVFLHFSNLARCLPGVGSTAAGLFFLISQRYAANEKRLGQPPLQLVDVVQDLFAIMRLWMFLVLKSKNSVLLMKQQFVVAH